MLSVAPGMGVRLGATACSNPSLGRCQSQCEARQGTRVGQAGTGAEFLVPMISKTVVQLDFFFFHVTLCIFHVAAWVYLAVKVKP